MGQIRKKEEEAKSGSAAYKPTKRHAFIKSRLGFLHRNSKTRKSISTLPDIPEVGVT